MDAGAFLNSDPDWEYQSLDVTAVAACVFAPAIMWVADMIDRAELLAPRRSISSYHDVLTAGAFFIPLSIAVMLFVVNGWIYAGHRIHVAMGAYLLGVIVFDHVGRTLPLHFAFAGAFFVVGAFLEAVRDDDVPNWSPRKWILMAPILPGWILLARWTRVKEQAGRAGAILLPFVAFGLVAWGIGGWIGDRWLFFAEWFALTVLVSNYLRDARIHAHKNAAMATASA
jgi:hypothetical protein